MSPRAYRLGRRQADADATHARILGAARHVLAADDVPGGFSIDAVAREADVARQTVYNRFGSRAALLEALFDDLAVRGGLQLTGAFQQPDPAAGLRHFIRAFTGMWAAQPLVYRRLAGLAALDPELADLLAARAQWRREGLRVLLGRLGERDRAAGGEGTDGSRDTRATAEVVEVLHTLTSFATYDAFAREGRGTDEVADLILRVGEAFLLAVSPPAAARWPVKD